MIELNFTATAEQAGIRIDALAPQLVPDTSRSGWQARGEFERDGKKVAGKTKVIIGEKWTIRIAAATAADTTLQPWDFELKILAESDSWVAIEKPVGIAVHPSPSDPSQQTIVNALLAKFGKNLSQNSDDIDGVEILRPGLVHRLDKPTSGVLLVAKTDVAHRFFQAHWGDTEKWYRAVVVGRPPVSGRIDAPIDRDPRDRQRMGVSSRASAKNAETFFEREAVTSDGKFSLLRVRIPTGRTHQIRVHLSAIGFAIVGDTTYGGPTAERLMLHAEKLKFPDPDADGKIRTVECPVPEEFLKKFVEK